MNIRGLLIDDNIRANIERVVAYATRPDRYYDLDKKPWPPAPGHDPRHVVEIPQDFRVVFSITRVNGKLYRHISISIPSEKWPHPMACMVVAEEFGFTGFNIEEASKAFAAGDRSDPIPDGWLITKNDHDHCIVIAQELPLVN